MKKIIAFAGSNSKKSVNKKLIEYTSSLVLKSEIEILDLNDYPAPVYGVDLESDEGFPKKMVELNKRFEEAHGFMISVPEHNGSMPAVFKNTVDWISRMAPKVFYDKPVLFLGASPGPRAAASVLEHLLKIMPYRGAKVIGGYGIGNFADKYENGTINDVDDVAQLTSLVSELESSI